MERNKVLIIAVVLSLLVLVGLAVTQVTVQGGASLSSLVLTSGTGGSCDGSQGAGNCAYKNNIDSVHGQH